jgi:high-affinity nickel permease
VFGLDDSIAGLSNGTSVWLVILAAVLLGLRHATDPDHLAAMTALVAGGRERAARAAGELGLFWGLGHGLTLFAFGLPILLLEQYLPDRLQQTAETVIALVIVYLAVRLLMRWRTGVFHSHAHTHDGTRHAHLHPHEASHAHGRSRTRAGAFSIGLVHGIGGSAGVGVLIVASVESAALSVASLGLLAAFTAVSMSLVSTGFGAALVSRPLQAGYSAVAPALAVASLAFGIWYGTAAWGLAPYPF